LRRSVGDGPIISWTAGGVKGSKLLDSSGDVISPGELGNESLDVALSMLQYCLGTPLAIDPTGLPGLPDCHKLTVLKTQGS